MQIKRVASTLNDEEKRKLIQSLRIDQRYRTIEGIEGYEVTIQCQDWNCRINPITLHADTINTRVNELEITANWERPLVRTPIMHKNASCDWCVHSCIDVFKQEIKLFF